MPAADDLKQSALYTDLGAEDEYEVVSGLCELPVGCDPGSPEPRVVFPRLHPPYRRKVSRYRARKSGAPPVVPAPESSGGFTFVGGTVTVPMPAVNITLNSYDWEVGTELVFVEAEPSTTDRGFVLTRPPFLTQVESDNRLVYGSGPSSPDGTLAEAGPAVRTALAQAAQIDLGSASYRYDSVSYYPGAFLNPDLARGEVDGSDLGTG